MAAGLLWDESCIGSAYIASLIKAPRQPLARGNTGPASVLSVRICHLYCQIPMGPSCSTHTGLALAGPVLGSPPRNPQSPLRHLLKVPSPHSALAAGSWQLPAAASNAAVPGVWLITTLFAKKQHQETFWAENNSLQNGNGDSLTPGVQPPTY